MKELCEIQKRLKAPKGQTNSYGGYKYRSCEDILSSLKPLLYEQGCHVTLSDEMLLLGGRFYIKSTAALTNSKNETVTVSSFAREEENKKGMDAAQITGSVTSYARKYALCGLFGIDGSADPDALNTSPEYTRKEKKTDSPLGTALTEISKASGLEELAALYRRYSARFPDYGDAIRDACGTRKKELSNL